MLEKEVSFTRQAILAIIIVNVSWVAIFALSVTFHYFFNDALISLIASSIVVSYWIYKVYAYLYKNNFRILGHPSSGQPKNGILLNFIIKSKVNVLYSLVIISMVIFINNIFVKISIVFVYILASFSANMLSSGRMQDAYLNKEHIYEDTRGLGSKSIITNE